MAAYQNPDLFTEGEQRDMLGTVLEAMGAAGKNKKEANLILHTMHSKILRGREQLAGQSLPAQPPAEPQMNPWQQQMGVPDAAVPPGQLPGRPTAQSTGSQMAPGPRVDTSQMPASLAHRYQQNVLDMQSMAQRGQLESQQQLDTARQMSEQTSRLMTQQRTSLWDQYYPQGSPEQRSRFILTGEIPPEAVAVFSQGPTGTLTPEGTIPKGSMVRSQPRQSLDEKAYQEELVRRPNLTIMGFKKELAAATPSGLAAAEKATTLAAGNVEIPGKTVRDKLQNLPGPLSSKVKSILDYRVLPSSYLLARDPQWNAAFGAALIIDPSYDAKEFPARQKMLSDMLGAKTAQQIDALNTALTHVGILDDAIDGLQTGDLRLMNAVANRANTEFGRMPGFRKIQPGDTPVATYNAIVDRVGPELTRAYVGTGGEASERVGDKENFNPAYSPDILHQTTAKTVQLLLGKVEATNNRYTKNSWAGAPSFHDRFLSGAAQDVIKKLVPGALEPQLQTLPAPSTNTQQELEEFYRKNPSLRPR